MANESAELTIEDLADRAGVSVRTVRYYIGQGLLAGPGSRGRAASYGDEHLARLRLIRRLAEQHVPLAEQQRRLEGLSLAEVLSLLGDEERRDRALQRAETARSPRDYVAELLARARAGDERPSSAPRSSKALTGEPEAKARPAQAAPQPTFAAAESADTRAEAANVAEAWHKWQLAPGIELHARADAAHQHSRLIERLLETAREAPGRVPGSEAAFHLEAETHDNSH